jgi:aspartate aminotransferase
MALSNALATHPFLSDRITNLEESQTIAMAKKGRELAAKGHDVINLSFGEPDFETPKHIREAAKQAIDEGWSHYPPVAGYPELRKAVSDKFKHENGLDYSPEQIVVSTGAKQSIANVLMCLVNPGDEVIILGPYWVSYQELVKLCEGIPVIVSGSVDEGFKPSAAKIQAAITGKTKLIMYSAPSNPAGAVFTEDEMEEFASMLQAYPDVHVLADEIYEHILFEGKHQSIGSFPGMLQRTITVNGLSKAFAMTGYRLGYMGAPLEIAKACDKMQGQITSGANSIAQRAAITALTTSLAPTEEMSRRFKMRRDACVGALLKSPGLKVYNPHAAFYLLPDVSSYYGMHTLTGEVIANSTDLCLYLLQNYFISLVPGDAFGDDRCIRFSFAAEDGQLVKAMERFAAGLASLQA